jgi:hypothetical protein
MTTMPDHKPDPYAHEPEGLTWAEARAKLRSARGTDRLILLAGVAFFVSSFLPWYGESGWHAGVGAATAIFLGALTTAFAAVRVMGVEFDLGDIKDGIVYLSLGAATFGLVVLRYLTERDASFGLYIALGASAVLAIGGFTKHRATRA